MKIKHLDLEIRDDAPFFNCRLDRYKYAVTLTNIIDNYKEGFVLAINSEWGTGKTTFVKMWEKELQLSGFKTLFLNAWENDFAGEPLVAIMSELDQLVKTNTKNKFKSVVEKGALLTKKILPGLIKAVAEKYIDSKTLVEALKDLTEGSAEIFEGEIKGYTKKVKGLSDFKKVLSEFISSSSEDKPIVFIIDELDRCRPSYAVELLEQIKHFFSVPGIVFILSIDKVQLGHAVRGVYGNDRIDADEYLRRFIDLEFSIPPPETKLFCRYLFDYFGFDEFFHSEERKQISQFSEDRNNLISISSALFEKANLSLRKQEKIFAQCRLCLLQFKENSYVFPDLYLVLVFLKNFHGEFYRNIKLKQFSPQGLLDEFAKLLPKVIDQYSVAEFIYIETRLVVMYNNSLGDAKIQLLGGDGAGMHVSLVKSYFAPPHDQNQFANSLNSLSRSREGNKISLEYLCRKIDLTEDITV